MRHIVADVVLYVIAILLITGAAVFGYLRMAQHVISDERTVLARFEPVPQPEFRWAELGAAAYVRNCMSCHGRDGMGWDQYPGLDYTAALFAAPGGRDYLVDVHLYGLTSDRWRAPMPPMGHMQDVALAAVLNYTLTSFGNEQRLPPGAELYLPEDIAQRRDLGLSPWNVNERRPRLN